MRHNLKNIDEAMHFYANNVQESGRCGSVSFQNGVFYSYKAPIARRLDNGVTLLSNRSYSVTTSSHQSGLRRALHGKIVQCFDVEYFPNNRRFYDLQIEQYKNKAARANKVNRPKHLATIAALADEFNKLCDACDKPEEKIVIEITDSDLAAIRLAEKDRIRQEFIAKERRDKEQKAAVEDDVTQWRNDLNGNNHNLYYHLRYIDPILKISKDGLTVYTSRGAEVPVADAKKVWRVLVRCRADSKNQDESVKLGHYWLTRINHDGSIKVGCHDIAYAELERIACQLGLISEPAGVETCYYQSH